MISTDKPTTNTSNNEPENYTIRPNRVTSVPTEQAIAFDAYNEAERQKGTSLAIAAALRQRKLNQANSRYHR